MMFKRKVLVVLDVYNDFRDDPAHMPVELRKTLTLLGDNTQVSIYLVACGFEEYLHDSYSNFGPDAIEQRKTFISEMQGRLQFFADAIRAKGFAVECLVHWTYPRYEHIAKEAQELDVDLVVQHVNTQKFEEKHNLSHDTWQLVKTCVKPMLLIKNTEWLENPVILAAVDPVHSHHKPGGLDHKILDISLEISQKLDGSLQLVHAYSESARPFAEGGKIKEMHSQAIDSLVKDYSIDSSMVHLIDDKPANAILQCVDDLQASIVVLGALSRSRLSDAIIGNTADRVLDYIHSDLLIVKPIQS
ncbi:MAG: universal stress protein [Gammaproteobacteria bacterium]|nr:universal stress protein [Gammaproteobacteria bacterium]